MTPPPQPIGLMSEDISKVYPSRLTTLLLTVKSDSDQKVLFWMGSRRPAGLPDGEAGIKTSYSPTGALIGAELGNF